MRRTHSQPGWVLMTGILLAGIMLLAGCKGETPTTPVAQTTEEPKKPAAFFVSDLRMEPLEVQSNEKVTVSVLVSNTGDEMGTHEVTLTLNGKDEGSKQITLAGGASDRVGFTIIREISGNYTVNIGGLSGMFTIKSPEPKEELNPPPTDTKPSTQTPTEPTQPPPEATPDTDWTILDGTGTNYRAVHMGGNWGTNKDAVSELPAEYFEYLRDLNVNWVGISVALHLEGSMDSTVELKYSDALIPTFSDDVLRKLIQRFRQHGFNVYIHMAFESGAAGEHPVQRWQLGDPFAHTEDDNISPEFWPWRTDHLQHQQFVAEFWQTYSDCLVHIARIAEEEGVGLFTLGTETDRLFRSRSGGQWPNHFLNEMQAMVSAVREVYGGMLGYEMHHGTVENRDFFGPGSDNLVQDLELDFVGVSAYFSLYDTPPSAAPGVDELETKWEQVFQQHLIPLQERNPGKPIIFTEFGYVDSLEALCVAAADEFTAMVFKDKDDDGLDEGQETQANCYQAFFNLMDRYPDVVKGAFLWDTMMSTEEQWEQSFGTMRTFSIRQKLAEDIVRQRYEAWR